jgi:hypothetical protein
VIGPTEIERRFAFHPATDDEKRSAHGSVRSLCRSLADDLDVRLPDSREKSLAITHLEEVMFWANAAVARPSADRA